MTALRFTYIEELKGYIVSGQLVEDFMNSPEERRLEILEFLEQLMDLGDAADEAATAIIFRKNQP